MPAGPCGNRHSLSDEAEKPSRCPVPTLVVSVTAARVAWDLADALGVSPSTATRMCDRLVRKA